jgi:chromosome partitioning protein
MTVIAVLSQKGGSGKTTIATNLAAALHHEGKSVSILDTDPQGSSMDWGAMRQKHLPDSRPIPVLNLPKPTRRDLSTRDVVPLSDFYILDGEPQVSDRMVAALKLADLILIPVQPSPYDIWASAETAELVKMRLAVTDGLRAAFVVSRAVMGTELDRAILDQLGNFGLPVLETRIHQRVIYPGSAAAGMTAVDRPKDPKAYQEIYSLMDEALGLLVGAKQ